MAWASHLHGQTMPSIGSIRDGDAVLVFPAYVVHLHRPGNTSCSEMGLPSWFLPSERLHQFTRQEEVFLKRVEGALEKLQLCRFQGYADRVAFDVDGLLDPGRELFVGKQAVGHHFSVFFGEHLVLSIASFPRQSSSMSVAIQVIGSFRRNVEARSVPTSWWHTYYL